jgi:hypothetical protein
MFGPLLNLDPNEAMGILARAALALETDVSNPDAAVRSEKEDHIRHQIYDIAASKINLSSVSDDPYQAAEWISAQLDDIAPAYNHDTTRARLAESALLSSENYDVTFAESFTNKAAHGAVDKDVALKVIKDPDAVSDWGLDQSSGFSMQMLLGRWIGSPIDRSFHFALVVCDKSEAVLNVHDMWRVIPSIVDISAAADLLDVYRRFCVYYGFTVRAGGKSGRFIDNVVIRKPIDGATPDGKNAIHFDVPKNEDMVLTFMARDRGEDIDLAFVAAINIKRYVRDLRRRKIIPE